MKPLIDRAMERLSRNPVTVDVGGGAPFQKYLSRFRPLFEGRRLLSLDRSASLRPSIVGDALRLPFPDATVDGIICSSVLEHLPEPWRAVEEIRRVLKPGGLAYVYTPFLYPDHGDHRYGDYYRFTSGGLRHLFRSFASLELEARDDYLSATLRFLLAFRVEARTAEQLALPFRWMANVAARVIKGGPMGRGKQTTGFDLLAVR